ncbi:hypothetical protein HD554DRAFT_1198305 [Boletus coccyginus]|nr:hypothetical protein HD554DRAFT_1198305 [Boletus coccyginus]
MYSMAHFVHAPLYDGADMQAQRPEIDEPVRVTSRTHWQAQPLCTQRNASRDRPHALRAWHAGCVRVLVYRHTCRVVCWFVALEHSTFLVACHTTACRRPRRPRSHHLPPPRGSLPLLDPLRSIPCHTASARLRWRRHQFGHSCGFNPCVVDLVITTVIFRTTRWGPEAYASSPLLHNSDTRSPSPRLPFAGSPAFLPILAQSSEICVLRVQFP